MGVLGWTVVASIWLVSVLAAYGLGHEHGRAYVRRAGRLPLIRSVPAPTLAGKRAEYTPRAQAEGSGVWPLYTPRRRSRWRG